MSLCLWRFLALGLSFTLAIQAIANMAVTVNLFLLPVCIAISEYGGNEFHLPAWR